MSDEIWLEKYRPQTLEEVQGNIDAINSLKVIASEGNIPNMIIVGPPGIGKTSSILCLARTLLKENYKQAVIELNASDDRGIDVVRDIIKGFAQKKVNLPIGLHKIIILDEADSLTEGAQQALRMIISDFADTTRFVLSCNESAKIIDAIQSRCAILRFTKLNDNQVCARLLEIMKKENIQYDEKGLAALIYTSEGDMRYAINNLQATFTGFKIITEDNVLKICDVPDMDKLRRIIYLCVDGDFNQAMLTLNDVFNEGFTTYDIVHNLTRLIQNNDQMDINLKYAFLQESTLLKMRVLEGLPTQIQVFGFLAKLAEISIKYLKDQEQQQQNNKQQ